MRSIKLVYPMTLGDSLPPKPPQIYALLVALHIFVVSKHRDFLFGVQVDRS